MVDIERPMNVVVTGASKGIGKATALTYAKTALGRLGDKTPEERWYGVANVAVGCRSTNEMAVNKNNQMVKVMQAAGCEAIAVYGDLTVLEERTSFVRQVGEWVKPLGGVDVVVLNAAGGLEEDVPEDYGNLMNNETQVALVQEILPHMAANPTFVLVESSWSELYPDLAGPPLGDYRQKVSATKKAGRDRIVDMIGLPHSPIGVRSPIGARALVLAAGIVHGTAVARMAEHVPDFNAEQQELGNIVDIADVARTIVAMTHDQSTPHGHVEWVGAAPEVLLAKYPGGQE